MLLSGENRNRETEKKQLLIQSRRVRVSALSFRTFATALYTTAIQFT